MNLLAKNTPIFFKVLPKTEDTPPDAVYIGFKAMTPKSEAHDILYRGEHWTVRAQDFRTVPEALSAMAKHYQEQIDAVTKPGMKRPEIAKALGVSDGTLRKRMGFIRNHLTKRA